MNTAHVGANVSTPERNWTRYAVLPFIINAAALLAAPWRSSLLISSLAAIGAAYGLFLATKVFRYRRQTLVPDVYSRIDADWRLSMMLPTYPLLLSSDPHALRFVAIVFILIAFLAVKGAGPLLDIDSSASRFKAR